MRALLAVEPLSDHGEAARELVARSLRLLGPSRLVDPSAGVIDEQVAVALAQADHGAGYVALSGGAVAGVLLVRHEVLTPEDEAFTWARPAVAQVGVSGWHVDPAADLVAVLAVLVEQASADALAHGIHHLTGWVRAADWEGASAWAALGFRPETVLAGRVLGERAVPSPRVRVAAEADRAALVALATEEILHHAEHTSAGTSADQDPLTVERTVDQALAAMADGRHVSLVAELDGAVVGSLAASVLDVSDTSPARGWLPAQHLYIGLTSVTAGVRGRGFGADLVEAALAWATDQGLGCAMLHYVVDNDLARPFWTRQGFVPVITGWTRTTG